VPVHGRAAKRVGQATLARNRLAPITRGVSMPGRVGDGCRTSANLNWSPHQSCVTHTFDRRKATTQGAPCRRIGRVGSRAAGAFAASADGATAGVATYDDDDACLDGDAHASGRRHAVIREERCPVGSDRGVATWSDGLVAFLRTRARPASDVDPRDSDVAARSRRLRQAGRRLSGQGLRRRRGGRS
jgi:hypothetical protein